MRDHIIKCVDTVIRSHPECGVIITGDFNQLQDNFLRTHYRFVQVVEVVTRGQATFDNQHGRGIHSAGHYIRTGNFRP